VWCTTADMAIDLRPAGVFNFKENTVFFGKVVTVCDKGIANRARYLCTPEAR
jgi:hypothetical protein